MSKPLLIGLLLAIPLAAQAKPKAKGKQSAKVHVERAAKAHQAGKYQVALSELETAYSIDPQPKLLYAIGQVHAKLGNCTQAVSHYEKFLATIKDKSKQEVVKQAISACKSKEPEKEKPEKAEDKDAVFRQKKPAQEELPTAEKPEDKKLEKTEDKKLEEPLPEPKQEPRPEPAPVPEPVREPPPPEPRRDEPTAWYRDWLGGGLVLGGVGVSIASYFVYQSALSDLDSAESAGSLEQYQSYVDSAHEKRTYTIILAGAGVTLVAAGILRYATRDSSPKEARGVSVVPTQGGGLITWSGGF